MNLSFAHLKPKLTAHPNLRRLLVGYSGGVDSHVLLYLLASHRDQLENRALAAVYVDHGLQPASGAWGHHCEAICRQLGVDFSWLTVNARPSAGESPEAAARRSRYEALAGLLGKDEALLTAHHVDDQAETLLLQLLRGGGPHGLAAMPAFAPLGQGLLLRPLLAVERAEILAYAQDHRLHWVEDASNADHSLDRNYLRHEIMPRLKSRWPAAARTLARSARLCAEAAALADAQAASDLAWIIAGRPDCLVIARLRALSELRQRNVLRYWCRSLKRPVPGEVHLHHILTDAVAAPRDRKPCIRWPGSEVRRYQDRLFAMAPLPPHDPTQVWPLTMGSPDRASLIIPGIGCLSLRAARGEGVRAEAVAAGPLTIRFRRGGERFRPYGRRHSQALKKLLQEAGVPPWERERLPLLYVKDSLVAIAGLWIGADFRAQPEEDGLVLEWQRETDR